MNPKVDAFFEIPEGAEGNERGEARNAVSTKFPRWKKEIEELRSVVLGCGLKEELKWGKPCYTWEGRNIVVIQAFKDYCALLFLKGYLVSDPGGILVKTGPNTRVGRQARFVDVKEIVRVRGKLKGCVMAAVGVERDAGGSGKKVGAAKGKVSGGKGAGVGMKKGVAGVKKGVTVGGAKGGVKKKAPARGGVKG
jgi:uncharacterized protein YdeI (YjbR/CyaY-like superfamily)